MKRSQSNHTRQSRPADDRHDDRSGSGTRRDEGTAALHRTVGNQAVKSAAGEGGSPDRSADSSSHPPLALTDATDASEREATRLADRVMRARSGTTPISPARTPSPDGGHDSGTLDDETAAEIDAALAGGTSLPGSVRSEFEARFGQDLSSVRVHTGPQADAAARSIDAAAFTVGSDIAFASGNYEPESPQGKRLLAHELTHVVQQTGGGPIHRLPAADPGAALPVQRRLPDNVSGYSQRDAERSLSDDEKIQRLIDAGIADPGWAESILSTASNVETVVGTTVDVVGLFGLEAGAAYTVGGSLSLTGTASALLTAAGPVLFAIGAMISWANALETDDTIASAVSGAYTTVAIAKGRPVPVDPVGGDKDFSENAAAWNQGAERVRKEYRRMFDEEGEDGRKLLIAMTALQHQSESEVLNRLYQASVSNEMSGVAREMAQRYLLLWPPEYGVRLHSEETIGEAIYDDPDALK